MNRNLLKSAMLTAAATVCLLATGCATTRKGHPPVSQAVPVKISTPSRGLPLIGLNDRNDPNEVVRFALSLSDAGRHGEAAQVLLDAAGRFVSDGARLEQDLVKAAIREHWLAGDLDAVRSDFQILNKHQRDIYDASNEDDTIRGIRSIAFNNR